MSLKELFYPRSIVVIGASTQPGAVGNEIVKNLVSQKYGGKLFLVNPKGGVLYGKKLLTSLEEISDTVELAVIAIPAAFVTAEIEKAAALGIKAVVVISAGFKESGNHEGEELLLKVCEKHKISLIGPNCLGVLNPAINLNASFAPLMPSVGPVAFVSQSGAICASVLDYAKKRKLGFSKFLSVGNKAMVDESDLLEYLYDDSHTKIIALYVEQLDEIETLRKIAFKVTHGKHHKPIIVLKSGRTVAGRTAALSHTGSLGSSDAAYEALFAQTGMIRAETIDELFDLIECFSRNSQMLRSRVAVVTNAGGPGVLTADALIANGLQLAKLQPETITQLQKVLPAAAGTHNPIDILGDAPADRYLAAVTIALADPGVDAVQVILTPQSMTEIEATAKVLVSAKKHTKKPLVVTFMGQSLVEPGLDILYKNAVATSHFPEPAARALAVLHQFRKWLAPKRIRAHHFKDVSPQRVAQIIAQAKPATLLSLEDAHAVLKAYGFPLLPRWTVRTPEEATALAAKVTHSVVLKIMSPDISHKSESGGVVLDVAPKDIPKECEKLLLHVKNVMPKAKIEGVEVLPMISSEGVELILGMTTDPVLGKQIVVGLGGIYAEVLSDVSWGLAPLTQDDIERMIAHLKTAKILAGIRGKGPFDTDAVEECLARLSQLSIDIPEILEIDINPLKVLPVKKGALVLDARVVVERVL